MSETHTIRTIEYILDDIETKLSDAHEEIMRSDWGWELECRVSAALVQIVQAADIARELRRKGDR